ncbi:hypothetical protein Tco_0531196 [Tanacetum coccineum]
MAPRAVLMKTGLKSFNTARLVNTVRSVNTGRPFSTARSYALSWKPCQGDSLNLPDHRFRRRCCSLILDESQIHKPHAHTQAFKVNRSTIT